MAVAICKRPSSMLCLRQLMVLSLGWSTPTTSRHGKPHCNHHRVCAGLHGCVGRVTDATRCPDFSVHHRTQYHSHVSRFCGADAPLRMFHSSRLCSIKFEETVRCQCHSCNCLDGTPDGHKSFTVTCSGSIAACSTPGSSASEPWLGKRVRLQSNDDGSHVQRVLTRIDGKVEKDITMNTSPRIS